METEINKKYSNFRADVNGKEAVRQRGRGYPQKFDREQLNFRQHGKDHKMIGPVVADDIISLVKHRNKIAQKIGFSNYHEMSLELSGQDPEEVTKIFDELDSLTQG